MPKKRPTELPETVKQRATPKRSTTTPRRCVQNEISGPAVLVSDPTATRPDSPTRPPMEQRAMVHQPPATPEPEPQQQPETLPAPITWWESEISPLTSPPIHPSTHSPAGQNDRGRVGLRVTGDRLEIAAQGADVFLDYDPSTALPMPADHYPAQDNLAYGLLVWVSGFGFGLVVLMLALLSIHRTPQPNTPVHPTMQEVPNVKG